MFKLSLPLILLTFLPGCTKFQLLDATISAGQYHLYPDLSFAPDPYLKLDVYRPLLASDHAPVVIFFYGGNWEAGEKSDYRFVAEAMTRSGIITVIPNYRTWPGGHFPGFVEDAAAALKWTQSHIASYGGDPNRIFLMGHSAGAHIAMLLTLDRHYLNDSTTRPSASPIAGIIGLAGPYYLLPLHDPHLREIFAPHADDPAIDPHLFARGDAPPMILFQGLSDDTVDPRNARALAKDINDLGGRAQSIEYPNTGHVSLVLGLADGYHWLVPGLYEQVVDFILHPPR